ncbi:GTP cyclohydrolase II RibA [Lentzea albidocapillata]|uniref:GTP cyclohydrolase II RibA n=1 Tax=Lentzea albidocapillata TaxID=40571 RepID=UPI000A057B81|nr:GTP cyclohydrolase II RibA [Lentzea albidocapillata]
MKDYLSRFVGASATVPTRNWGPLRFTVASFSGAIDGDLVVTLNEKSDRREPLVRIHSECVFAEVFSSKLCDCSDQLDLAMTRLSQSDSFGILFYLRIDGRGAGLAAKVAATNLEINGADTWESRVHLGVEPDSREYRSIANYLESLGIQSIRLLTNNPNKVGDLADSGIEVRRLPLVVPKPNGDVRRLYETKRDKFGHLLGDL